MTDNSDRLREPPAERLATPSTLLDLRAAAEQLWREQGVSGHGHRQKVVARHGGATLALFVFEAGASLPPHAANGSIILQCIDGELTVAADGATNLLRPGSLLFLAPKLQHDVRAITRSTMLLTVSLEPEAIRP